jgi:hypothetical protein
MSVYETRTYIHSICLEGFLAFVVAPSGNQAIMNRQVSGLDSPGENIYQPASLYAKVGRPLPSGSLDQTFQPRRIHLHGRSKMKSHLKSIFATTALFRSLF